LTDFSSTDVTSTDLKLHKAEVVLCRLVILVDYELKAW